MPLDEETIKKLLAQPEKPKRGTRNTIDTTIRTYATWFKLAHKFFDHKGDIPTEAQCSNPSCSDPRKASQQGRQLVAEVNGLDMCRFCFLDGYGLTDEDQLTVGE